jgi:hypothetical protein
LHPDYPSSPQDIVQKLKATSIHGVTTACRLQAVEMIRDQRVFEGEDDMKQEALAKIKQLEGTSVFKRA